MWRRLISIVARQEKTMLIGELAKQSGFPRDTIRYYEKLGLVSIGVNRRAHNGYKNYPVQVLERLQQIYRLKECGFTLLEIRRLLVNGLTCEGLPVQLAEKISKLDEKLTVLMEYKQSLLQIQQSCNGACSTIDGLPACIPHPTEKTKAGSCC
jgi:DNA-binding transcriptional MerR regulator